MREGLENYSLLAKSSLPPVVVNTVLLEPGHAHSLKLSVAAFTDTSRVEYS